MIIVLKPDAPANSAERLLKKIEDAGLKPLLKKIVECGFFVVSDALCGVGFFGHEGELEWERMRTRLDYNPAQNSIL